MKTRSLARPLAALLGAIGLGLALAAPAHAVAIEPVTSPGGIKAWLVEDHTLKMVSLQMSFRGGIASDPADKEGLANLLSGLLDEGAGDLDSAAFHAKLNDLTASFDVEAGMDQMTVSTRVLSDNLPATADLVRLAITEPRFEPAAVDRIKSDVLAEIAEARQTPDRIAELLWRKRVFGDHPYGRSTLGTPESLARVSPADLHAFVHDRFAKDNVTIGVVGDITPDALKSLLDKIFGKLADHAVPEHVAEIKVAPEPKILLSKFDVPQSVVIFGENGLKRDDADWYAAALVMHILGGGGFDARLTEEVRVKRGLAYSISAALDPMDQAGILIGDVATRNEKVAQSIEVIRAEWKRMRDEGPTDQELASAKTFLTGSFPLNLDSTSRIAALLVTLQREHLGLDYLDRRNALLEGVTLAQARDVAKRLLDPNHLLFVVVGAPDNLPGAETVAAQN